MTSYASVNNQQIVSGSINVPYYGTWAGDVLVANAQAIPSGQGACTVVIGNLTLTGTAFRTAGFSGSRRIRLVGGYAGWRQTVPSKAYANNSGVMLSMVLRDVASEVGESITLAQDTTIGPFYIRENAPAQRVLRQLAGPTWWMSMAGVTQVGPRTTTNISTPYLVVNWDGAAGSFDIATEDNQSWMPGNTFSNDTVTEIQTIGMTTLTVDDKGTLRMRVLSTGNVDV